MRSCPRPHAAFVPASVHGLPRRGGFSLVELLVAIGIVGLLVGLLLPAMQSARESARRVVCQNNLRQIATAILVYEQGHGRLPMATLVKTAPTDPCTDCFNPWNEARGSVTAAGEQGTSWMLDILPQLDETALADAWNRQANVAGNATVAQSDVRVFYCPSRRSGIRQASEDQLNLLVDTWTGGGTDYGGCHGRFEGFDPAVATGRPFLPQADASGNTQRREGVFRPNVAYTMAAIRDGQSNTIMLGELQRLRPVPGGTSLVETAHRQSQDGWAVGGAATLFVTSTSPADNPGGLNNRFFQSPGSEHVGGAFFAMADGSIHWISEFIDAADNDSVFPLLGSMRDGEIATVAGAP
jgi:prepilin-type N-terminal cleavage/methylation domain-containing protein